MPAPLPNVKEPLLFRSTYRVDRVSHGLQRPGWGIPGIGKTITQMPALRSLLWVTAWATSIGWLFILPTGAPFPYHIDFDVYRCGGQVFLNGGNIYGELPPLGLGGRLPFTYPPIAALLFSVFALGPMWFTSTVFTAASIAALWWLVWLLARHTTGLLRARGTGQPADWLPPAALILGCWLGPIRETLGLGQINLILTALILTDIAASRRRPWTGVPVGAAMAIKLTPAVFLLYFLLRRDWRSLRTAGLSFLTLTGLGFMAMPGQSIHYWTRILQNTGRIGDLGYASNQSINGMLVRLGLEGPLLNWSWLALAMLAGLLIALVGGRLLGHGQRFAAGLVVGFAALLCSPVAWDHHWILVGPLLYLIVVWALTATTDRAWWWGLAASGLAIFLISPHWLLPHKDGRELDWAPWQQACGALYPIWGVLTLVAIGLLAPRLPTAGEDPARFTEPAGRTGLGPAHPIGMTAGRATASPLGN